MIKNGKKLVEEKKANSYDLSDKLSNVEMEKRDIIDKEIKKKQRVVEVATVEFTKKLKEIEGRIRDEEHQLSLLGRIII